MHLKFNQKIIDTKDLRSINKLDNIEIEKLINDYKISDEQISSSYTPISLLTLIKINFKFFQKQQN